MQVKVCIIYLTLIFHESSKYIFNCLSYFTKKYKLYSLRESHRTEQSHWETGQTSLLSLEGVYMLFLTQRGQKYGGKRQRSKVREN